MVSSSHNSSSASNSPRVPQGGSTYERGHAPSAFRSPPAMGNGFDASGPSSMLPTRAAPAPPGQTSARRESTGISHSPAAANLANPTRQYSKSASNSPNPNRYSAGASTSQTQALGMTTSNGSGNAPPPRPTRAGTLPLDQQLGLNTSGANGSAFREHNAMSPTMQQSRSPNVNGMPSATGSSFLSQPTPPPLQHQPFSAPINPYAVQALDQDFEEKVGLGMGTPMGVVEPRDKDLPKEPVPMGRNRSGTGKSSKDKKSVFGVLSGESGTKQLASRLALIHTFARTLDKGQQTSRDLYPIRSYSSHSRRLRLQHRPM